MQEMTDEAPQSSGLFASILSKIAAWNELL